MLSMDISKAVDTIPIVLHLIIKCIGKLDIDRILQSLTFIISKTTE